MDDIDKELKKVQLQREKLALQKELARDRLKEQVFGGAAGAAAAGAGSVVRLIGGVLGFVKRWWHIPFAAAIVIAAILVSIELQR